jgi:hypothetical protein
MFSVPADITLAAVVADAVAVSTRPPTLGLSQVLANVGSWRFDFAVCSTESPRASAYVYASALPSVQTRDHAFAWVPNRNNC